MEDDPTGATHKWATSTYNGANWYVNIHHYEFLNAHFAIISFLQGLLLRGI